MTDATRRVRRLGYGLAFAGLAVLGVTRTALPPGRTTAILVGFLAVGALVLERTQGAERGFGFGLLTAAAGVVLWPRVGAGDFEQLWRVLVLAGALNAAAAPLFARFQTLGERLADDGNGDEE